VSGRPIKDRVGQRFGHTTMETTSRGIVDGLRRQSKAPIVVILMVASLGQTAQASTCHLYSRWYYPTPQRCGLYARGHERPAPVLRVADTPSPPIRSIDIPIPDMSATWTTSLDSPALLDLSQSLPRLKAIRLLTQGE
jgi:hypothetical protein